jgi:hypothetical protein
MTRRDLRDDPQTGAAELRRPPIPPQPTFGQAPILSDLFV